LQHPELEEWSTDDIDPPGTLAHIYDFYMLGAPRFSFSSISFVTGCASPQVAYMSPGSPAPTNAKDLFTFTMAATPASVQTPPASYIGGIGVGYDSYISLPVTLTSVYGFSGQVSLSAPRGCEVERIVFTADPPVALDFGNSPSVEVVSIGIYVMPVVLREPIASVLLDFRWRAPITPTPAIIPATLAMTSGGSRAWQKGNWFMGDRRGVGKSADSIFPFPVYRPLEGVSNHEVPTAPEEKLLR
jgi:hypothetical protein